MTGELSGVDLARQALVAAREAAKKNGATQTKKPKRRTTTVVRRDGREPLGLGAAIGLMMTERGIVAPAAGRSVLADFDAILTAAVPELAGRVQATASDVENGRLDVVPDAPAVRTKLRWSAPKLIAAANERVPDANVRALNVLAPAPVKIGTATTVAAAPAAPALPAVPVERRPPPDGYRRALAAHQEHRIIRDSERDARVRAAAEDQARRLRQIREPEEAFTEIAAQGEILREQHERADASARLEASVRAALAYKRRSEGSAPVHRLSAAS